MPHSDPTTVPGFPAGTERPIREELRIVECVGMSDPIDHGEPVAEFPPGTGFSVIQTVLVELAMANRGVDYSVDVFSHKAIWERFASVRYEAGWTVEPVTGIILSRGDSGPGPDARAELKPAEVIEQERAHFEKDRARRLAAASREVNRAQKPTKRTAQDH